MTTRTISSLSRNFPIAHLARRHAFTSSSPLRPVTSSRKRTMFSGTAAKHEYLAIIPDHKGALPKRMEVRPTHLKNLDARLQQGFWRLGGATLDEELKEGQGPKINGSVMLAYASSSEEVLEALKADIYNTSGVWNLENVQIIPFKSAFIRPGAEEVK